MVYMTTDNLFLSLVLSVLSGLAPYYVAALRGNHHLARVSLAVCWAAGFVASFYVSIPAALVFIAAALLAPNSSPDSAVSA